jgi:ParB-like chromosome segregation protein Spo0J
MPEDRDIPLANLIEPHDAMRFEMDDTKLDELIGSIRLDGVLERLLVIELTPEMVRGVDGYPAGMAEQLGYAATLYEVRAGHRRLLACRALAFSPVPCTVFKPTDSAYSRLMATENLMREEPSEIEEAELFRRYKNEPGMTEEELRRRCGKSLGYIYSMISIVEGDEAVALALHRKQISKGVALKLNQIRYPAPGMTGEKLVGDALQNAIASADAYRAMFLERAVTGGCSIAQAESWVAQWRMTAGVSVVPLLPPQEPMPPGGYPQFQNVCAVCGERDRQETLEGVYIHHDELVAIRAAVKAQTGG